MVERRCDARLAQEPLAEVVLPDAGRQQLQGGLAPEPDVLRAIDDAGTPAPELLPEAVAAELGADATVGGHPHEL